MGPDEARRRERGIWASASAVVLMAFCVGLSVTPPARASHPQPAPNINAMEYHPIGKYGPAGQNTLAAGETPSATIPAFNSPLTPTSGLKYNPSGEYVAYDTNLFESLTLPYRAAGDESNSDPPGNGSPPGTDPRYGFCAPGPPPVPSPAAAAAGRCPNHQLEYLDYFEETMKDILGPFGVTVKRYGFQSPGGLNTEAGQSYNIAAVVPGADHPDETVVVSGHYDQTVDGPASSWDSAEGHAEVIRMAKIMADYWTATGTRPSATIKFAPWDQEESGLLGSADYVANNIPPGEEDKVRAYFNVDPCAGGYPAFYRGNPADRAPLTMQVVDPEAHADDPDFLAEINAFNARAETVVDEVFDHLDDQLSSPTSVPTAPQPIYVSDAEAAAGGPASQRDEVQTAVGGLLLFTSDYTNFEAAGIPFMNLGPGFFGPSADGTPNRNDGIAMLHTPNDNARSINALTSVDQTGQTASEGWAKGMELCAHLESWYMLQPEMAGGQTADQSVVAYYEALPNEAIENQPVSFSANGTYQRGATPGAFVPDASLTYSWDFGDGTTGTGKNVQHSYAEIGKYTSRLTVTNTSTGQTDTMTIPITVIASNFVGPELDPVDDREAEDGNFRLEWEFDGAEDGFDRFSVEEASDISVLFSDPGVNPSENFDITAPTNAAIDEWQPSDSPTLKNRGNLFRSPPRSYYTGVFRSDHQPGVGPSEGDSVMTTKNRFAVPTGRRTTLTYFSDFANDANDTGRVEVAIDEGGPLDWQVVDSVGLDAKDEYVMSFSEEPTELMVPNFELRNVDLTRYSGRRIRLRWVYQLGIAQFVNVYRHGWYVDDIMVTAGTYSEIGRTPLAQRTFDVAGRRNGSYGYRVVGVYADGVKTATSNVEPVLVTAGGSGGGGGGEGCANEVTGTKGKDNLKGTSADDRIRGRGGDDKLKGRIGDDCLSGQGGEDRIAGGAGADELKGGRGKDRLKGGGGDDKLRARRGGRDRLNCGPGRDVVFANRKRDRIAKNCEKVRQGG